MGKTTAAEAVPTGGEVVSSVDPEAALEGITTSLPDGEVTFTRPGVESMTFQVKDGKISTTKERMNWLLTHVVGTGPAAE